MAEGQGETKLPVELKENMEFVMDEHLTNQEKTVLCMRYGFGEFKGSKYTFKEIGSRFGVGSERARQLEWKALRKLRHLSVMRERDAQKEKLRSH